MKRGLFFLLPLTIFFGSVVSNSSVAQNSQDVSDLRLKRIKSYKDIGLKMIFVDSEFNEEGTRLRVQKGKKIIFDGNFIRISGYPDVFKIDSLKRVFLFTTWSGGAHCCSSIITGLYDGSSFHLADTLFIADGSYKLRDLDSDGVKEILLRVDYFPYRWTSFSGADYDLAILKIDSGSGRLLDVSSKYPERIMKYVKSYLNYIQKEQRDTSMPKDLIPEIKQEELACLLMAYISLGKESEGWEVVRKEYRYKDRNKYFKELKEEVDKGRYLYGHKN